MIDVAKIELLRVEALHSDIRHMAVGIDLFSTLGLPADVVRVIRRLVVTRPSVDDLRDVEHGPAVRRLGRRAHGVIESALEDGAAYCQYPLLSCHTVPQEVTHDAIVQPQFGEADPTNIVCFFLHVHLYTRACRSADGQNTHSDRQR